MHIRHVQERKLKSGQARGCRTCGSQMAPVLSLRAGFFVEHPHQRYVPRNPQYHHHTLHPVSQAPKTHGGCHRRSTRNGAISKKLVVTSLPSPSRPPPPRAATTTTTTTTTRLTAATTATPAAASVPPPGHRRRRHRRRPHPQHRPPPP